MIVSSDTLKKVQVLLAQHKKVMAVKIVKEDTNCSLKEAKDYVDQLEQTKPTLSFPANIDNELRTLLAQGKKIEAIKLYKDNSGQSLADSKYYVEHLDQSPANIDNELRKLLAQGKKLEAVKTYRDFSGQSLADSKYYVEHLNPYGIISSSTTINKLLLEQKPTRNNNWTVKLLILIVLAALLYWAFF